MKIRSTLVVAATAALIGLPGAAAMASESSQQQSSTSASSYGITDPRVWCKIFRRC